MCKYVRVLSMGSALSPMGESSGPPKIHPITDPCHPALLPSSILGDHRTQFVAPSRTSKTAWPQEYCFCMFDCFCMTGPRVPPVLPWVSSLTPAASRSRRSRRPFRSRATLWREFHKKASRNRRKVIEYQLESNIEQMSLGLYMSKCFTCGMIPGSAGVKHHESRRVSQNIQNLVGWVFLFNLKCVNIAL